MKECHRNVQRLARVGERRAYGLALDSGFGVWLEHSWLVAPNGSIIETTMQRDVYFGVVSRRPVRKQHWSDEKIRAFVAKSKKELRKSDRRVAKAQAAP